MMEDFLIRSDIERLNDILVLPASFKRNEMGINEASRFEAEGCLGFLVLFSQCTHTQCELFTAVNVKNFMRI